MPTFIPTEPMPQMQPYTKPRHIQLPQVVYTLNTSCAAEAINNNAPMVVAPAPP